VKALAERQGIGRCVINPEFCRQVIDVKPENLSGYQFTKRNLKPSLTVGQQGLQR
jgi:hypothetical protein